MRHELSAEKPKIKYPVHPKVRRIIKECLETTISCWATEPSKSKLAKVRPQYRGPAIEEAARSADMTVVSSLDRAGLTKPQELQLFYITDKMREAAARLTKKYPLK